MATTWGSTIQGKNIYVTTCGFMTGTVLGDSGGSITAGSPSADAVVALATCVPKDGAVLVEADFIVTSPGSVTTSGTQEWSITDGTNVLATRAATNADATNTPAGTVLALTMGSATNGTNAATTTGAVLNLTNTEVGTIGDGLNGIFRLVWHL